MTDTSLDSTTNRIQQAKQQQATVVQKQQDLKTRLAAAPQAQLHELPVPTSMAQIQAQQSAVQKKFSEGVQGRMNKWQEGYDKILADKAAAAAAKPAVAAKTEEEPVEKQDQSPETLVSEITNQAVSDYYGKYLLGNANQGQGEGMSLDEYMAIQRNRMLSKNTNPDADKIPFVFDNGA